MSRPDKPEADRPDALEPFHPAAREWFTASFPAPTPAQALGWPVIARGESALILAPTGSGKTLAAFLWCINRLMFAPLPNLRERCRVLYVSPLKALAVDIERNLRAPIAGIGTTAARGGHAYHPPMVAVRSGDTPAVERARFKRAPADILITTPESLYLILTTAVRETLRSIDTVIVDEIHALVGSKRGAHLMLSIERLQVLVGRRLQRIGLSATARPVAEVARFLGGAEPRGAAGPTPAGAGLPAASDRTPTIPSRRDARRSGRVTGFSAPDGDEPDPGPAFESLPASQPGAVLVKARDPGVAADSGADEQHRSGPLGIAPGPAPAGDAGGDGGDPKRERPQAGGLADPSAAWRPVTIVDATEPKPLRLRIEVPVQDMAKLGQPIELPSGPAAQGPQRASIWAAIHPRLLELVRAHRSTLIFVNNRRGAERLAAALNELAIDGDADSRVEDPAPTAALALAHHGSLARAQRIAVEDKLKAGSIRALVATSSLELGIDMGAVDLVVQIEAPPSVASGLQRIGRAGHQVGAVSEGIIFPKYRGDLVACAAVTREMHRGAVEAIRYPRSPLDVLAQQIVAMTAVDRWEVDPLFAIVRSASPFAELPRPLFEGVLDMLAGRYPSDQFAELRPRIIWDRVANTVVAREGARRVALINGGTIPDRGLYGVFLAGAKTGTARVGELDEEMVFESRVGETFVLGASSWRIDAITHDRVLVSPAPGQPGKMPFWRGDAAGRPLELGRKIGQLVREIRGASPKTARDRLIREHDLDQRAADNLIQYLADQAAAGAIPDDGTIVVERYRDELGDWRVCVLSPLGGRIHAPWAMAVIALGRREAGVDVETMWADDGFVARFPERDAPPDVRLVLPDADEIEHLVQSQLGSTALFAAKFREAAARALLLPKRRPDARAPLWQQRRRAADLLAVAAQFGSFPMLLETYRECLRDVFDMPALVSILREIERRQIRVITVDAATPSPFAASLLFGYVANYIYDGDAPLAERRAQVLSIDQAQLRELLGDLELRELLDPEALGELERQLQHLDARSRARSADALHDLLRDLGDLSESELRLRTATPEVAQSISALLSERRAIAIAITGERRFIAIEDASRYRDALGIPLPPDLPAAFLEPVRDPRGDLAHRYARTHGPFTTDELARRLGLAPAAAELELKRLTAAGKLLEGQFRPTGRQREWCDPEVLRNLRRRSLAKLRQDVEPVAPEVLGRLITTWQGVIRRRSGPDALLAVIETLQGAPLPASTLERDILAARIDGYLPADLDALAASGEIVWCGVEPLGERDGRVALYLTHDVPKLWRPSPGLDIAELTSLARRVLDHLTSHGASFFAALHAGVGGGFAGDLVDTLWTLVWMGRVTNDTFHALRAYVSPVVRRDRHARRPRRAVRAPRATPPAGAGRWSLTASWARVVTSPTAWSAAAAQQLLTRYGIVTRESAAAEWVPGGFTTVYEMFKALEDAGRIRRGYFVTGVSAAQFALPAALDQLRVLRDEPETPEVARLSATDPANPYGAILKWPAAEGAAGRGPARSVGATVILVNGACAAYIARGGRVLSAFLPDDEPKRSAVGRALARELAALSRAGGRHGGLLLSEIDGAPASEHALAEYLIEAGFSASALGLALTRREGASSPRRSEWQPPAGRGSGVPPATGHTSNA